MHSTDVQKKFIQLRSQGLTFDRIAKELNVSRGTLINWSRKFRFEIQNLRAIELESLQEQLLATREIRARALTEELRRVEEELKKRDLASVSTGRLYGLAEALRRQVLRETGAMQFTTPSEGIPDDEYYEQVQDWNP
jgi:transposase